MKILNRYILKEHIPPFIFAVFIITFILILETIPKIVELVIDKDIKFWVVLELIFLNLAWMIALSVPMAVLVATLMAFGRLTSDSEIVAIKSSGVNLLRVLIPLLIASAVLTFGMIKFSDKILPVLNLKARVLAGDISAMRPTLTFRAGVFITDITGYIILIDKIDHVTSEVEGIRISDIKNPNEPRIIVAKSGLMKFLDDGQTVQFTLYDGEIHMLDKKHPENYRRVNFTEQVINVGGVGSELKRTPSNMKTDREMNISEMRETIAKTDSVGAPFVRKIEINIANKLNFLFSDSLDYPAGKEMDDIKALGYLKTDMKSMYTRMKNDAEQINQQNRVIDKYLIEIYKKYSIPAASIAFVLFGAPIAILSRRGGMAMAATISLLVFTVYWAFLIGGEDLGDRGIVSPFVAMWSANFLIGAAGLYLMAKVISEKPLFSFFRR